MTKEAARHTVESVEIEKKAREHEKRHHGLTIAATLIHVAIAISTIAIITKGQRWPWYAALVLAGFGILKAFSVCAFRA